MSPSSIGVLSDSAIRRASESPALTVAAGAEDRELVAPEAGDLVAPVHVLADSL